MKPVVKLFMVSLVALGLVALAGASGRASTTILKAKANIQGLPGSGISGTVKIVQIGSGAFPDILPTVLVFADVSGLAPGTIHGVHIHEVGSCTPDFNAAGGHFDPGPFGNSSPPDPNHPFHMGDLPNLKADSDGDAHFEHRTSRITLSASPLSIFDANGSSIIVHVNADQGTNNVPGGAGGGRLACGVLVVDND